MKRNFIQLTLDERRSIEQLLKNQASIAKIAKNLNRNPQTISREIKRNRIPQAKHLLYTMSRIPNNCIHRKNCEIKGICNNNCQSPGLCCYKCDRCNEICIYFENDPCPGHRDKAPWVCNSCPMTLSCTRKKLYYRATQAHQMAERRKLESRQGVNCTESEIEELNAIFSPRLKQGQSIHAIYQSEIDRMICSERSIYTLIDMGLFTATNIDLPLKVRRRLPKRKVSFKIDKKCFIDRTYTDFKSYIELHPDLTEVQMDTVLGPPDAKKALLTLYWKQANFLLIFLMERCRSIYVIKQFEWLYQALGAQRFKVLFPLILTDRGSEFTNPTKIEKIGTKLFYCDPQQAQQKGAIEQEHAMLRRVIPKGKYFEHLTQKDISLANSHITSYLRPGLGNKTPQDVFGYLFGHDLISLFGLEKIKPSNIVLTNKLLPGFVGSNKLLLGFDGSNKS